MNKSGGGMMASIIENAQKQMQDADAGGQQQQEGISIITYCDGGIEY